MNAAARLCNQGELSRSWVVSVFLIRFQFKLFAYIILLLFSALGTIYVTNVTRSLNAGIQQSIAERDQLHVQWGQLLLEKSSLIRQARIQNVAEGHLDMVVPTGNALVVVNLKDTHSG